jgi:hypothetical protein
MQIMKPNQNTLLNRPIVNVPTIPISTKIGGLPSSNMIPQMGGGGGIPKPLSGIGIPGMGSSNSMMVPPMGGITPPMGMSIQMGMVPTMGGITPPMGGMTTLMGGMAPPMGGLPNIMGGLTQIGGMPPGMCLPMNITSPMVGMQVPPMGQKMVNPQTYLPQDKNQ